MIDASNIQLFVFNALGVVISILVGVVLFFLRRLILDVKETTTAVGLISEQIKHSEKFHWALSSSQDQLSERVRRSEIDIAILMSKAPEYFRHQANDK